MSDMDFDFTNCKSVEEVLEQAEEWLLMFSKKITDRYREEEAEENEAD